MQNHDAYNENGFNEWLMNYKNSLSEVLKKDKTVRLKTFIELSDIDLNKNMISEGLDYDDVIDYYRLYNAWDTGALDGALAYKNDKGNLVIDDNFNLVQNDTFTENLKALRFMLFLNEKFLNNDNIKK